MNKLIPRAPVNLSLSVQDRTGPQRPLTEDPKRLLSPGWSSAPWALTEACALPMAAQNQAQAWEVASFLNGLSSSG